MVLLVACSVGFGESLFLLRGYRRSICSKNAEYLRAHEKDFKMGFYLHFAGFDCRLLDLSSLLAYEPYLSLIILIYAFILSLSVR